jgi:hypothetical protein
VLLFIFIILETLMTRKSFSIGLVSLASTALSGCYTTGYTPSSTSSYYRAPQPVVTKPTTVTTATQNVVVNQQQVIQTTNVVKNKHIVNAPVIPQYASRVNPAPAVPPVSVPSSKNNVFQDVKPVQNKDVEATQIEEVKRRSLETKTLEDVERSRLEMIEKQQLDQAIQNSLVTKAEEDRKRAQEAELTAVAQRQLDEQQRQQREAVEAELKRAQIEQQTAFEKQQLGQAIQNSLFTKTEEDRKRAQEAEVLVQNQAQAQIQAQPSQPSVVEPIQSAAWVPNEGMQVKAGEKLMELKKASSAPLTRQDMQNHLQKEMVITSDQALKILEELGID